jgi:16S rRNA (guanine527-N7)-methyltransferase
VNIGSNTWKQRIGSTAASLGVETDPEHLEAFAIHARELLFWNRRTNLTAVTDPEQMALKHFVDSLVPIRWIAPEARVLDLGSGAGFPGIPLKVVCKGLSVTLVDAVRKKVSFMNHVIRLLGLFGIESRHVRAEQLPIQAKTKDLRFDVIISRAVGALDVLVPMALPLIGENGILIAMIGKKTLAGSAFVDPSGALEICDVFDYRLPDTQFSRSILCLRRNSALAASAEEG